MNALSLLQLWHLALLALVPLLFAAFRMVSEPYDPSRALAENVVLIGGAALSAYALVFLVRTGRKDDAVPGLLKLYRQALFVRAFLVGSNVLLTAAFAILVYQLVAFRQVEFLSRDDVELYVNDDPTADAATRERLGFVRARAPAYFRLALGQRHIVAKDVASQRWVQAQLIDVPPPWRHLQTPAVWIAGRTTPYEPLR